MSAPTPPPHPPVASYDARTEWLGPRLPLSSPPVRRMVLPARTRTATLVDVAARIGTVVTLAALLIVAGTVLTMVDAEPVPTGATTTGP
jgi:hypothetical protein